MDLAPAWAWIKARGGCPACAKRVLDSTEGDASAAAVAAALERAGAPTGVRALLGKALHAASQQPQREDML